MNLPYFLRPSPSPLKHFSIHIFSFNSNPDNSSAGQWNWLPTDTPTEGHTLYRTHLELGEVEVMVYDGMGWFTRWGYQYWVNKAQQANDASMGILSTLSTFSRKKVELLIRLFDFPWETRFSNFSLRRFGKVGPFLGQGETSDETNTINKFHNYGSNETMQKVLVLIV